MLTAVSVLAAGPPPHIVFRDMSVDTVVAVLAMVGAIVAAVIVPLVQHSDRSSRVISDMTQSQSDLQDQIDKLDRRLIDMYTQNQRVEAQIASQQSRIAAQQTAMDEDAAYIRSIAHWLQQACEVMDIPDGWSDKHPKPHLPDSIRSRLAKGQKMEDKNE